METEDNKKLPFDQSQFHELEILKTVDEDSHLNNRKAATKLGVSVKLAHTILGRMVKKGLLHIKKENTRKWHYYLTPNGIMEKSRLTISFFEFSMQFYKEARKQSAQLCSNLNKEKRMNVLLLGTGELAEIVYLGIQEWKLNLLGAIDTEDGKKDFMGAPVYSPGNIPDHDAIIICLYDPQYPLGKKYIPDNMKISEKMEWIFN
ncbi:MAG: winged helix-turn-helix transcriptional regulator [Lentisphaeraceae bacterium]|nr:winged helix-turn-helix transcriptional regulator [Lentisphaeraceae bacterium]